jgi:signal-transduction protein with cAMP-binding, CBS, and nucleotidyltransferase domain
LELIRETGYDQFPVKDNGVTVGVLTDKNLLMRLYKRQVELTDTIKRVVSKDLRQVSMELSLNELSRVVTRNSFVLVEDMYFLHISDVLNIMCPKPVVVSASRNSAQVIATARKECAQVATIEAVAAKPVEAAKSGLSLGWLTVGVMIGAMIGMHMRK